jgi:MFS family permease
MASMTASAFAYLWLGAAGALWMLFAARALAGACAGNIAAAQAYIADITRPEERAHGMGMIGAAFGLGFIFGPALGGFLAGSDTATANLEPPAWTAAGLSFTALSGVLLLLRESHPPDRRGLKSSGLDPGRAAPAGPVAPDRDLFVVILAFAAMRASSRSGPCGNSIGGRRGSAMSSPISGSFRRSCRAGGPAG